MSDGLTTYWAKDAAWWRRGRIVELGQEHGPAGPAVVDWLIGEARTQGPIRGHDGSVKSAYAAVAHGCFLRGGADEARTVIATAVEVGLLDDFTEEGRSFTCRISGWKTEIDRPTVAEIRAQQRAREAEKDRQRQEATGGDSPSDPDALSPVVPPEGDGDGDGESSLRSDSVPAALAPEKSTEDEWPDRIPSSMLFDAAHVHHRLTELHERRGGEQPSRRRVGEVLADFPHHDHRAIAGDVFDYWTAGGGAKTKRKDWVRVYRDRCSRVVARPLSIARNGRGPAVDDSDAPLTAWLGGDS